MLPDSEAFGAEAAPFVHLKSGVSTMCDYSLHNVASTPAKVGDRLTTTEFALSGTRGFSAIGQPNVAVCLRPGTELAFDNDVSIYRVLGLLPRQKIAGKLARFRQVNMDDPHTHHDALEFPDGQIVKVTDLYPGQRATVLQLPAAPLAAHEREESGASEPALNTPLF
jgi:hypothetical protein